MLDPSADVDVGIVAKGGRDHHMGHEVLDGGDEPGGEALVIEGGEDIVVVDAVEGFGIISKEDVVVLV